MRTAMLSMLFAAAAAFGTMALPSTANARDNARIYVDLGDVGFSYGRPYYRYDRTPLYISYDRHHRPRYYRHAPRPYVRHRARGYYNPPVVVVRDDRHYRHSYRHDPPRRFRVDHHGRRHYYRH